MAGGTQDASALEAFRDSARDLLAATNPLERARRMAAKPPGFERSAWRQLAEAGWPAILVAEADGGLGLGLAELAAVTEQAGHQLLAEPFVAAGVQAVAAMSALPGGELRTALLDKALAGELVAGLAWQARDGQVEPHEAVAMRATRRDGRYALDGTACHVLPAEGADGWLVLASGDDGPGLYWVDAGAAGVTITAEPRADGSPMGTLALHGATAAQLCAGSAATDAVARANEIARIAQAAELLGVARRMLATTLAYTGTRVQFGKPIGSFQALQHAMVDAWMQVELAAACLDDVARHTPLDAPLTTLARGASRAKARAASAALGMGRLAIQMHGAIAYTDEYEVGLYFKRALALSAWLGHAEAHQRRHVALAGMDAPAAAPAPAAPGSPREFPKQADWAAMPEAEFRSLFRDFYARHYPQHLRHMPWRVRWAEIREWYLVMSRQGWIAPAWPREWGGMELPPDKLLAFIEEQEHYGVARPPDQGLIMLGPILMRFGTDEQRRRFLPRILSGEHVWCQGYSEPNAGSDLASLRCEALADGDDFLVSGQKTWTTLAQDATHMFMLVRTARGAKKQEGISFLLVDLASPGVTVRPIRNIAGHEEFCEVFFDKVRVPAANLVGELHQGWNIAKALLGFERIFGGSPKQSQFALAQLDALARARGLMDDALFVQRRGRLAMDVADLASAYARYADMVRRGEPLPASVSFLKVWATETCERIGLLLIEAAAEGGGSLAAVHGHGAQVHVLAPLMNAAAAKIFSGSNEIQRNILARQVLGMPA
jgi:alkylation response protein AidB-like acyl-CoA dehydrogenase